MFIGNVDYPKLPELYNASDVVAHCPKNEGFGLSITEGMACGKAIVATNVGGIPLQVKNNINGFLVEPRDIKSTAEKVIKILSNKS
jgi:glycosyltransferase involved in cell wall biosynthesis